MRLRILITLRGGTELSIGMEHIADEVMVMYLGRCVEKGTKDQIFNNPRHPYRPDRR